MNQRESCKGFSLIELLVVISIIAILASILLPTISLVREQAQTQTCVNNQRQIMMAVEAYAQDNEGYIPRTTGFNAQPDNARFDPYITANNGAATGAFKTWQCTAPAMVQLRVWAGWFRYYCNWGALDDPLYPWGRNITQIKRASDAMFCYDGDLSGKAGYHRSNMAVASFMDGHVISRRDDSLLVSRGWGQIDNGPTIAIEYLQYGGGAPRPVKGWNK
jgi:prepilin-type N-terminal cleavage/methylation domain-containing protein